MYTSINFGTKRALKEAIASGHEVTYFQPGPFGGNEPTEGKIYLKGPHYPEPHQWYAQAIVKAGRIISVK